MRRTFLLFAACAAVASPAVAKIRIESRPFVAAAMPRAEAVATWKAKFSSQTFVAADGATIPYRLYRPASRRRLPVVLILHGSGAIGTDNEAQMGALAAAWADPAFARDNPAIVVAPQAPLRTANYDMGDDGLLASEQGSPLMAILELVDQLAKDPGVDASRISVVGFSMGASAAMQALLARPDRFSAAVAFSAVPPPRSTARRMPNAPLLLVHGDRDDENPIAPDLAWAGALDRAGAMGRLIIYRGMDHRIPDDMLTDRVWRRWLLQQRR